MENDHLDDRELKARCNQETILAVYRRDKKYFLPLPGIKPQPYSPQLYKLSYLGFQCPVYYNNHNSHTPDFE
jgi:hypothetical protein